MPIYRIEENEIHALERTSFAQQGLRERDDLQALLKARIDVIAPDTLVVAEEFGEWDESRRRIDLLGLDKNANLVVIELKRTEDGGHMELQAIRYASMISTLTLEKLVTIHARYLERNGIEEDASARILEFLGWDEPDEDSFGQEVHIVLASAEFSKELTTSVMWLNDFGLNIRCVRMHPYVNDGTTFMDVQTVIPIPEVADYQVRIREKKQKERESRSNSHDRTKFDISVGGNTFHDQPKRWMMFHIVTTAIANGVSPEMIEETIPRRSGLFQVRDGTLTADAMYAAIMENDTGGKIELARRYFSDEGQVAHFAGKTYALTNQWGREAPEAANALAKAFPQLEIRIAPVE